MMLRIQEALRERSEAGLMRQRRVFSRDLAYHLASNDYLSLAKDTRVIDAGKVALERYGSSSLGSPLVSSYLEIHRQLEEYLADWTGVPCALLWGSGYSANRSTVGSIMQKGDIILADEKMHHSGLLGAVESGARIVRFRHNDPEHLEELLKQFAGREIMVLMESLYSMDGDCPELPVFAELKERYGFLWMVDEAHAVGWYGAGLCQTMGITASVDILMTTLGKSLVSQGACVLFQDASLREYVIQSAREYMYTTYLSPANTAVALQAARIINKDLNSALPACWGEARSLKQMLSEHFEGIQVNDSPIVPIILGSAERTMAAGRELLQSGILVGSIRTPSVPKGGSRLRISMARGLSALEVFGALIPVLERYASPCT